MEQVNTTDMNLIGARGLDFWAERYGVCTRTLYRAVQDGRLKCLRFGRAIMVTPKQFDEFIKSCEE